MTIDKAYLTEKITALEQQRDQHQANLNATVGAIQILKLQLQDLDAPAAAPAAKKDNVVPFHKKARKAHEEPPPPAEGAS